MEWIKCSDRMPETDVVALVCNSKGWMYHAKAIYHKRENVWQLSNPDIRDSLLLEVTHWIQIPNPPKIDE